MIPYLIGGAVSLVFTILVGAILRRGGAAQDDPPSNSPSTPFPPLDQDIEP